MMVLEGVNSKRANIGPKVEWVFGSGDCKHGAFNGRIQSKLVDRLILPLLARKVCNSGDRNNRTSNFCKSGQTTHPTCSNSTTQYDTAPSLLPGGQKKCMPDLDL